MQFVIGFIITLSLSHSALAAFEGLQPSKQSYPLDFLISENFIDFQPAELPSRAPLAAGIVINNQTNPDLTKYFTESFSANLPNLQTIKIKETTAGEVWDFPIGTRVIHEIRFNDNKNSVFEVRMVEKVSDKSWGYGTYEEKNGQLVLRSKDTNPNVIQYDLKATTGEPLTISLRQIPQVSCAKCHFNTSISVDNVSEFEQIGPCEFQPGNPYLKINWAAEFLQKKGWTPFSQ